MKQLFAALISALSFAAGVAAEPMEEVDYVLIGPRAAANSEKIEVIEFFYYGCDSCNRFEPQLQGWLKDLPADVSFRRSPALRRTSWVPLTALYFALEELGELERLHGEVYKAVHENGLNLGNTSELLLWAQKYGLDPARLESALESDRIRARVQAARDTTLAYGIRATPSLLVDGKYLTSGGMVGSIGALLSVLDGLIGKARKARAAQ